MIRENKLRNVLGDILLTEQDDLEIKDTDPDEESQEVSTNNSSGTETPEEVTPEENLKIIDKAFRLKKIYARLIALSRILDYESHPKFEEVRNKVLEAIELFHVIISNFKNFEDRLDEIINGFYKFLEKAIEQLEYLIEKE